MLSHRGKMEENIENFDEDTSFIYGKGDFIAEIAHRARFSRADVKIILDTMIEIFIEAVIARKTIFVRGFGKLYVQRLSERKSSKAIKGGIILPETDRVIFRLSDTIRNAGKRDAE